MPELPTTAQLAAAERRWNALRELAADPTVEADQAANVAEASARDVPQLLAWIRGMQPGYALLGHARRALDQVAANSDDAALREAAVTVADRITNEIGHPQTDEPALGPDLRDERRRLDAKVKLLKAAVAAALKRGDNYAADLARTRGELTEALLASGSTYPGSAPAVVPDDCALIIGALMAGASGDQARGLDAEQCASRLTGQITTWVAPHMLAELAAWLVVALSGANHESEELQARLAEATAGADLARRSHEELTRWLDSERSAQWRPRAWPVRPLTAEQERSVAADEARTDWPAWVEPCDPVFVINGEGGLLACGRGADGELLACGQHGDGAKVITKLEPTLRWSELVADVVKHRCQPSSEGGSDCCGGGDCAGKCGTPLPVSDTTAEAQR